MTPIDLIISKLFVPVNAERVQKAKNLASRQKVQWSDVVAAMTEDQRKQVENASQV